MLQAIFELTHTGSNLIIIFNFHENYLGIKDFTDCGMPSNLPSVLREELNEQWVGFQKPGFRKCHGEMGLKGKLNKVFLHFLPNFWHI